MTNPSKSPLPVISLSHFELYVDDINQMHEFYTGYLGFVVTDRGQGPNGMVFLSRNPEEHHQLVLNPRPSRQVVESPLDHISFRVSTLDDVRRFYCRLITSPEIVVDAVSHGTTWSLYFRDPEGNRLELFCDTPWHVEQPCKFKIDMDLEDSELYEYTELKIRDLPGFKPVDEWRQTHVAAVFKSPAS
jgi:catechol-2,3-dioxygenase